MLFLSDWMPENQISEKSDVSAINLPVCMCIDINILLLYKLYLNRNMLIMFESLGSKQILLEKLWKKIFGSMSPECYVLCCEMLIKCTGSWH